MLTFDQKKREERRLDKLAWLYADLEWDENVLKCTNLTQDGVDKVFECTIDHCNMRLANHMISGHPARPSQEIIDVMFRKACRAGNDPDLILYLQTKASQNELCSEERVMAKHRRECSSNHFHHYLVGFLEHEKLVEVQLRNSQSLLKAKKSVLRGLERLQSIFRDQLWINGIFFDCVHSQNKYLLLMMYRLRMEG